MQSKPFIFLVLSGVLGMLAVALLPAAAARSQEAVRHSAALADGKPRMQATDPQPDKIDFFGMNTYFTGFERIYPEEPSPPFPRDGAVGIAHLMGMGRALDMRWAREEISWGNLEPTRKGYDDWDYFDDVLRQMAEEGYEIIGMISTTPDWARVEDCAERVQRFADYDVTTQTYWCPPADMQDFTDIVSRTVERYDGDGFRDAPGSPRVAVWQIWNEPHAWETWPGTPAEFGALMVAGYEGVKAADPTAIVASAGTYVFDGAWEEDYGSGYAVHQDGLLFFDKAFAAVPEAWNAFDVLAVHPYMPTAAPDELGTIAKVTMWGRIVTAHQYIEQWQQQYGQREQLPLWITEVGWSTCSSLSLASVEDTRLRRYRLLHGDGDGPALAQELACMTEQQQANYMLRTHALGLALDVEHLNYFQLEDKFDGEQAIWGGHSIVHTQANDYRPKLAYTAYDVMTDLLGEAQFVGLGPLHTYEHQDSTTHHIGEDRYHMRMITSTLFLSDTVPITHTALIDMLWRNAGTEQVSLALEPGHSAELITLDGKRQPLVAQDGVVTFTVSTDLVYLRQSVPPPVVPIVSDTGQITVTADRPAILRYGEGNEFFQMSLPQGAVQRTTMISYTSITTPTVALTSSGELTPTTPITPAGRLFRLDAYQDGEQVPDFAFEQPVCITVAYDETELADLVRRPLRLYRLNGDTWQHAAVGRCAPDDDLDMPTLTTRVRVLDEFALVQGPLREAVYIPLMRR